MVRTTLRHRNDIESLIDSIKVHNISLESMASTQVPEGQKAAAKVLSQTIQTQVIDRMEARLSLELMFDEVFLILEGRPDMLESIWPSLERLSYSNRIREDWLLAEVPA
ncbi:MAG: hypothetical protein CMA28_00025 [Euryarchaeota archaeon]|jgi:hypothetical protein|nr:hypothetical protein [Euryarchaeota archaeon]|tara:strand:- start:1833 stop:2159 length:327 start_codon:yes stop_codon:yes gene_type:complete